MADEMQAADAVENQNTGDVNQTTDSSQVADENNADVQNEEVANSEQNTQQNEDTELVKKKAQDFESATKKWKGIAQELQKQIKASKTEHNADETDEWNRLSGMLDEKLAGIQEKLTIAEQREAIEEFGEMPHTKALGPEIQEHMKDLDDSIPFRKRLQIARAMAIADNADIIAQINQKKGMDTAYANKKAKSSNGADTRSNTGLASEQKNILERVSSMTREEYLENKPAIDAAVREQMGL